MSWFKKKQQPYVYTWESEPYVFQKGMIYVIEWDISSIELNQVQALTNFFVEQGIIVKLVPTKGGNALNPILVKRKKEQV